MRVFPSLCDWLDDEVPIEWLADFLRLIFLTPNLDWLLLTKRPENWSKRVEGVLQWIQCCDGFDYLDAPHPLLPLRNWLADWFVLRKSPANVWILVSVEDQKRADERIPELLRIPARVRGLSAEPLLGPVDLTRVMFPTMNDHHGNKQPPHPENCLIDSISDHARKQFESLRDVHMAHVDWVIVGGESGPKARACNVEWVRSIVQQCKVAGTAVFVKQLGAFPVLGREDAQIIRDKKGGDISEWPDDLRVREFPQQKVTEEPKGE
jgi:protein gp37